METPMKLVVNCGCGFRRESVLNSHPIVEAMQHADETGHILSVSGTISGGGVKLVPGKRITTLSAEDRAPGNFRKTVGVPHGK